MTSHGREYGGSHAESAEGVCQRWDTNIPRTHDKHELEYYIDPTWDSAGNMCRNPDSDSGGLWCYSAQSTSYFYGYCEVPTCSKTQLSIYLILIGNVNPHLYRFSMHITTCYPS